jgi:hypothetical protein
MGHTRKEECFAVTTHLGGIGWILEAQCLVGVLCVRAMWGFTLTPTRQPVSGVGRRHKSYAIFLASHTDCKQPS